MPNLTTSVTGVASNAITAYAVQNGLMNIKNVNLLTRSSVRTTIPKNNTRVVEWRRARKIPISNITATTEGVAPTGIAPQPYDLITATLQQYSAIIPYTDVVIDTNNISRVIDDLGMELVDAAVGHVEDVTWQAVRAGTQVRYSGTAVARANVVDVLTVDLLSAAFAQLRRNKAPFKASILKASTGINTHPVGNAYFVMGHSDLLSDLQKLAGWVPVEAYGTMTPADPLEVGKINNMRFFLSPDWSYFPNAGALSSTRISDGGTNANVYPLVIFGDNAYGTVDLSGSSNTRLVHVPASMATAGNPLAQIGTIGVKYMAASKILNENFLFRLEVAATKI